MKEPKNGFALTAHAPTSIFLYRANRSLFDMQCMMDQNGATDLVIDLIMSEPSTTVFSESVQLAIALLEGGNGSVQVEFAILFMYSNSFPIQRNFISVVVVEELLFTSVVKLK